MYVYIYIHIYIYIYICIYIYIYIKNIEDKRSDSTNLATTSTLSDKTNEVKREIPSITNLATPITVLNVKINEFR